MNPEIPKFDAEKEPEELKEATRIILDAGEKLLESTDKKSLINQSAFELDGEKYTLVYKIFPGDNEKIFWIRMGLFNEDPPETVENLKSMNKGEVASTRLMFSFISQRISGHLNTKAEYEGRGFGTALLFMRDSIIKEIMLRYKDKIPESGLDSVIIDNAKAQTPGKNYRGLVTSLAEKMGHAPIPGGQIIKHYDPVSENQSLKN